MDNKLDAFHASSIAWRLTVPARTIPAGVPMIALSVWGQTPSQTPRSNFGSSFSIRPPSQVSGSQSTFSQHSTILFKSCLPLMASRSVILFLIRLNLLITSAAYFPNPMDDRMVGGNRFANTVFSVQFQCSDMPLNLLDGLFPPCRSTWSRDASSS